MYKSLFIFFLGFYSCTLLGQVTEESTANTSKAAYFWEEIQRLSANHQYKASFAMIDSAIYYGNIEKNYQILGYVFQAQSVLNSAYGDYEKAIESGEKSIKYLLLAEDYQELPLTYSEVSTFYAQSGNSDKALEYLHKASRYIKYAKDNRLIVNLSNNYGMLFYKMGKTDSAYYYFNVAINNIEPTDSLRKGQMFGNIASVFIRIRNYQRGLEYLNKSYQYLNEKDAPINKNKTRLKMARLQIILKDIEKAQNLILRALNYFESTNNEKYIIYAKSLLAEVYLEKGNITEARNLLNSLKNVDKQGNLDISSHYYLAKLALALEIGGVDEINNAVEEARNVLKNMDNLPRNSQFYKLESDYYYDKKEYKKSISSLYRYYTLKDSLNDILKAFNIENLEAKYESEKKELLINEQKLRLEKNLYLRNLILSILLGLLFTGFIIYAFLKREHKVKNALIEKDLKLKEQEIEFLKKEKKIISMHAILEGQEEERKRIALDLHDNIGSMVTAIKVKVINIQENIDALEDMNIKDQLDGMINNVSTELRRISHNMTPIAFDMTGIDGAVNDLLLALENKGIEVINDLTGLNVFEDKQKAILLYRVFQEITQNILKHSGATKVVLESYVNKGELFISIKDDGVGIPIQIWNESTNLGLKSIKSRINYLEGEIMLKESNGTHLIIKIPLGND